MKLWNHIAFRILVLTLLTMPGWLLAAEQGDDAVILASYKGGQITLADVRAKIAKIPAMYQDRYRTTNGMQQIVDAICMEQLYYMEAMEMDLESDEAVQAEIVKAQRPVFVSAYREIAFKEDIVITDEEKHRYYDEQRDRLYTTKPVYTINYLRVEDPETANEVRKLFDDGGDFIDIQNQYSTSEYARNRSGKITFAVKHDSYIPGVGKDTLLVQSIATAEYDGVVGPITTENGIHFFRVLEFTDSIVQTYEQAEQDIINRLQPMKESERYYNTIDDLFAKYGVVINDTLLATVNLQNPSANDAIHDKLLAWGNDPSLDYTVDQLLKAVKSLPPQEAQQYTGMPGAVDNLVNRELEDGVFYLDAKALGYATRTGVAEELDQARRAVLIRTAFNRIVREKVEITDDELQAFYDENADRFMTQPNRTVQILVFGTEKEAAKYRKKVAKYAAKGKDDKIVDLVQKHSEFTDRDGVFPNLMPRAVVTPFGSSQALTEGIWSTDVGGVSDVFTSKFNGQERWIFVRVIAEVASEPIPLDDVRSSIDRQLRPKKEKEKFEQTNMELEEKYALQKFPERITTDFTAEELFTLAEDAQKKKKYQDAVMYYDQIVTSYPNGKDDYKALFMKAFLMAEEMNQKPMAIQVFRQVIDNYPEGELHESAEFMIKTITGEVDILNEIDETEKSNEATTPANE